MDPVVVRITRSMDPSVPLPIGDEGFLKELVDKAKDWAVLHGVGMRSKDHFSRDSITVVPFLLFPSPFPEIEFNRAKATQAVLNKLMHRVAHNDQFLRKVLSGTINVDPFTARLFKIYDEVFAEGIAQKISLGLFRSDYMIDSPTGTIKQVEFNTIASSFGGLTSILPNWHKFALRLVDPDNQEKISRIPASLTLQGFADGLIHAYNLYLKDSPSCNKPGILFVVEDKSYNIGDQRLLEFEIQAKNPQIRILRRTLTEIENQESLAESKILLINDIEIAVVYFRAGYVPAFYHSEHEWQARTIIEKSKAIKCPSIQYQLAGTKKVQQVLAKPGILEQFLDNTCEVTSARNLFTGLYSLDLNEPDAENAIQRAIEDPERFVLKPQREGGGNNLYDQDISTYLNRIRNSEERCGWILMDRINPPTCLGYIVRPGHEDALLTDVVSELGVFGVIIGDSEKIYENAEVGHMLRTKGSSSNEGGVSIGLGALDSVFLI